MSKFEDDFRKGELFRQEACLEINKQLKGIAHLIRIHDQLPKLTPIEKKENNLLINRISSAGAGKGMGLDYILESEFSSIKQIISIRKASDPNIYYKGFSDCLPDEMENIIIKNIYFLFLNPPKYSKFALVKGDFFKWIISNTKGNLNRMYAVNKKGKIVNPQLDLFWQYITRINEYDWKNGPRQLCFSFIQMKSLRESLLELIGCENK